MKRSKWDKKKYKMCSLLRKRTPGDIMLEPSLVLKEIRSLKKDLMLNRISDLVPSGQDPTC